MFSAYASSSIALSSAKVPVDSPGARMNVGEPTLRRLRSYVVSTFGQAYSIRVCDVDGSIQSSIVEVFDVLAWRIAVSAPSRVAPSEMRWMVIGRPPTGPNI